MLCAVSVVVHKGGKSITLTLARLSATLGFYACDVLKSQGLSPKTG